MEEATECPRRVFVVHVSADSGAGAYPLGLGWEYDQENILKKSVSDFESQKRNSDGPERIPEKVRKQLLYGDR